MFSLPPILPIKYSAFLNSVKLKCSGILMSLVFSISAVNFLSSSILITHGSNSITRILTYCLILFLTSMKKWHRNSSILRTKFEKFGNPMNEIKSHSSKLTTIGVSFYFFAKFPITISLLSGLKFLYASKG